MKIIGDLLTTEFLPIEKKKIIGSASKTWRIGHTIIQWYIRYEIWKIEIPNYFPESSLDLI